MKDNVVFLEFRNPELPTDTVEHLSCKNCRNKSWTLTYMAADSFPRLRCGCCGDDAGLIGWVDNKT